jgi:hypothetical protein
MEPSTPSGEQPPQQPSPPSGEQPTAPSFPPVYPPGQPDQPTAPSQPLYGQPTPPGPYSQPLPGPYSQPLYGQPGPYSQPLQAPPVQPKRSLRWLWITLAIVLVLGLLVGGGGFLAFTNYTAPGVAAGKYCGYLKAQNYDSAYGMLSSKLQAKYTSEQFRQASVALDNAEGKVTGCGAGTGSGAYKYTLFGNTATIVATTTREKQGLLQGALGLVNNGGWKVDTIASSLLGIDLGALDTLGKFCVALQGQDYTAAYALLGGAATTQIAATDFATAGKLHDQIDGTVSACALEQVNAATATATPVQVSLTRAKLGKRVGSVSLAAEGDTWKIQTLDQDLLGTDTAPLQIGTAFCTASIAGKYPEATALLTPDLAAKVAAVGGLQVVFGLPAGYTFAGCAPDLSTYKVEGLQATYDSSLKIQSTTGGTVSVKLSLFLVPSADGKWLINGIRFGTA